MAVGYGKIAMMFGGGKWGWQEEFFWASENATLPALFEDAKGLASARRGILSPSFSLEAVRMAITDSAGNTFLNKQNFISYQYNGGMGAGLLAGACTNPWLALLEKLATTDGIYGRNLYLRGLPTTLLTMASANAVPFPIPDALRGPLKEYNDYLTGVAGKQTGRLQIRAGDVLNRQNAVSILDVTVTETGKWQILTNGPVPIYNGGLAPRPAVLGDTVHVYGPRGKAWARGLSGDKVIVNPYDPDNPNVLTLSGCQAKPCPIDYLQDAGVSGVGHILVPIGRVESSRPVNKATGGAFFGTRGRASKKACC